MWLRKPAGPLTSPSLGEGHSTTEPRRVGIFQPLDHSDVFRDGHMIQVSSVRPNSREKSSSFSFGRADPVGCVSAAADAHLTTTKGSGSEVNTVGRREMEQD